MKGSSPQGRWGFPPSDATQTEICSPDITTGKGRLPKKNHVKSVVFCQTSLDPPGLVFLRIKNWPINLFSCPSFEVIWAMPERNWFFSCDVFWYQRGARTNTLHYIKSFCNGIGGCFECPRMVLCPWKKPFFFSPKNWFRVTRPTPPPGLEKDHIFHVKRATFPKHRW